jgi:glyoxylase I family protein
MLGVHHSAICTADVERSLRFWRDGLGLSQLFDHTFTGDWPELFGAKGDRLRSIFLGDPQSPDSGIVELVQLPGALEADEALPAHPAPRNGFFLLSLQRDVDETLSGLAALGFTDGVRRITMPAPGGKTVAMAVINAPDGVLVELIGPAT